MDFEDVLPAEIDCIGVDGPWSDFAERVCLGVSLVFPEVAIEVCASLEPFHFWKPFNRDAFTQIKKITEGGKTPDLKSVAIAMIDHGLSRENVEWMLTDACDNFALDAHHHGRYVQIVIEKWTKRQYMALGKMASKGSSDPAMLREWAMQIQEGSETVKSVDGMLGADLDFKRTSGVPSFFGIINRETAKTTQGWAIGQTHAIVAYRGGGKTAAMLQDAFYIAENHGPVIYFTFSDLDIVGIRKRVMYQLCGHAFDPDPFDDRSEWAVAAQRMRKAPFRIIDATKSRGGRDIESAVATIRKDHRERGAVAFYLDYIQKIKTRRSTKNSLEVMEVVSDQAQVIANELGMVGVIGSQLTLGSEKAGTLDKTKGGVVLEEDCASLLKFRIYPDDERLKLPAPYCDVPGASLLFLDKNRYGKSLVSSMSQWREEYARFDNL